MQQIARNLFQQESIERYIRVQGVDDPVPVPPRLAEEEVFVQSVRVGVARQVQPMPPPSLAEVGRVLRPRGRFYAEEPFGSFITRRSVQRLLRHPEHDRFDHDQFCATLTEAGLDLIVSSQL